MKIKKAGIVRMLVLFIVFIVISASTAVAQQKNIQEPKTIEMPKMTALTPVRIERVSVLSEGELVLDAGLAYEFDREWQDREYDNFRLAPLGMRYGVTSSIEVGGFLGFSANDRNDSGAPDDSGLEGISIFGKMSLNDFASLQVGLTLAGDDDVHPYPSDEVDLFINLPLQRPLGKGLVYGEFGYTVQGGDLDDSSYFSYGIGYALPMEDKISLNFELAGDESHAGTDNSLDLLLGANFLATERMRLAPFIVIGLFDASPDFAMGSALEFRF